MVDPLAAPGHLKLVAIASLVWNLVSLFDYILTLGGNEWYPSLFPPEIAYFSTLPFWVQLAWTIVVWPALLGSLFLLVRSKWAEPTFWLSLAAIAVIAVHSIFGAQISLWAIDGPYVPIATIVIFGVAIFFALYARTMRKAGYLA